MNTVGATIDDLREGDQVSIFYATPGSPSTTGEPINAMRISKVGEATDAAQMGDTAEWRGTVDRVDGTTRTVTVGRSGLRDRRDRHARRRLGRAAAG